jgi:hypothetical protein
MPPDALVCVACGPETATHPGRLAQRESAAFTRQRSLVRSQYRPRAGLAWSVPFGHLPGGPPYLPGGRAPDPHGTGLPLWVQLRLGVGHEPPLPGRWPLGHLPRRPQYLSGGRAPGPLRSRAGVPLAVCARKYWLGSVADHDGTKRLSTRALALLLASEGDGQDVETGDTVEVTEIGCSDPPPGSHGRCCDQSIVRTDVMASGGQFGPDAGV